MVCLQNVLSSILAGVFGWDLRLGLCTGSIPMVGGHGTAGSYGPLMEDMGIESANVIAIAAATYGLVAGSLMGGPTARGIINKYNLKSTESETGVELNDMSEADREKAEPRGRGLLHQRRYPADRCRRPGHPAHRRSERHPDQHRQLPLQLHLPHLHRRHAHRCCYP